MKYLLILLFSFSALAQTSNPNVRIMSTNGNLLTTKQAGTSLSSTDYTLATKAIIDAGIVSISGVVTVSPTGTASVSVTNFPNTYATSSNQTNGTQKAQIIDVSGTNIAARPIGTQVVSSDNGLVVNATIHGLTTGGGGGYVDVKVDPSGALATSGTFTVNGIAAVSQTNILPNFTSTASVSPTLSGNYPFAVLVSNPNRKGAIFDNSTDNTCWMKFGTAPTSGSYTVRLLSGGSYIMTYPIYTGAINGICAASATTGVLTSTEQ